MKRSITGKGNLRLHTKYKLTVKLEKLGAVTVNVAKFKRRLFIAKKPFNPRRNFIEQAQSEVFRLFRCISVGINVT